MVEGKGADGRRGYSTTIFREPLIRAGRMTRPGPGHDDHALLPHPRVQDEGDSDGADGQSGGVVRDVLAQRRPLILTEEIYALAALAGAAVVALLAHLDAPAQLTRWLGVAVIVTVRVVAIRRQWNLPRFTATDTEG